MISVMELKEWAQKRINHYKNYDTQTCAAAQSELETMIVTKLNPLLHP